MALNRREIEVLEGIANDINWIARQGGTMSLRKEIAMYRAAALQGYLASCSGLVASTSYDVRMPSAEEAAKEACDYADAMILEIQNRGKL